MPSIEDYQHYSRVVGGLRYRVCDSTVIAHDYVWHLLDPDVPERHQYLLRTPRGRYYLLQATSWPAERDRIVPLTQAEAERLYSQLPEQVLSWEQAFGYPPEDA